MIQTPKTLSVFLFVLSLLLYANTIIHDYALDDYSVIKENHVVKKGIEGIPIIWKTHYRFGYGFMQASLYRPLTLSIFAIQWELAPDVPLLAHLCNVLLYALLGVLIFWFLFLLFGKQHLLLAFISSCLFISHPIHTEVVANIKSLDDILALGFSISGLIFLFKYIDEKVIWKIVLSLFCFMLAFLSKESTIMIVLSLPLMLVLFRSYSWIKSFLTSALFLIPFAFYLILRINALGSIGGNSKISKIDNLLLTAPDVLSRTATAIKILGLYLWKLLIPHPLMNDYSLRQIEVVGINDPLSWLSLFIYALLVYLIFHFWKKQKIIAFSIAFFLITISLYSNLIITIGTSFGERLLFIPSLAFCIALAYLLLIPFNQLNRRKMPKAPLWIAGSLVFLYSFKTFDRNKAWENNFTLYSTDIKNCSKSARCHYYYGLGIMQDQAKKEKNENLRRSYLTEAIQEFNIAIQIYPEYSEAWGQKALAHFRLNELEKAETAYIKASQLNPANVTALSNLGSLYFQQQKYVKARKTFERAIQINPNHLDALSNYASTLGTLGEYNSAISYFKRAIAIKPNEPSYYQMIGITYQNLGNQQEANYWLQKAQSLRNQQQ